MNINAAQTAWLKLSEKKKYCVLGALSPASIFFLRQVISTYSLLVVNHLFAMTNMLSMKEEYQQLRKTLQST